MGPKKIAAYLVFAGEMREPAKAELVALGDPKPGMGDIAKRVGEKWKLLSEDEKAAYKTKAETINAENEREYAAKVASGEIVEGGEEEKEDAEPDLSLPLARVKRIMRLDKEVKNTAVDACRLISRATELFVESLVEGAYQTMKAQKRKTVKHADVEHHVLRKPRLEFLHDHGASFVSSFSNVSRDPSRRAARVARPPSLRAPPSTDRETRPLETRLGSARVRPVSRTRERNDARAQSGRCARRRRRRTRKTSRAGATTTRPERRPPRRRAPGR